MQSQKRQNDLCSFPKQTIQYHEWHNPSLCPTNNVEEAEVERFYEDLQDLLELTAKNYVLFIIGDWNAEVENSIIHKYQFSSVQFRHSVVSDSATQ